MLICILQFVGNSQQERNTGMHFAGVKFAEK